MTKICILCDEFRASDKEMYCEKCRIKPSRKELGLTQAQLAPLLGVSVRTIQDYEQGRIKPSKPVLMLLELELKK
jgi:DNA-binding transcriptional regulator YiaG